MTIKIKQHIPNFAQGFTPKEAEAETIGDLLDTEWIRQFLVTEMRGVKFWRYSISTETGCDIKLMAEYGNIAERERGWWVIGYLSEDVDLPRIDFNTQGVER